MSQAADTASKPLLVFDGDCGFCTSSAEWVLRHLSSDARIVPWQKLGDGGLAALGLSVGQASSAAWWVDERGRSFGGHLAIGKALADCRPPWNWLGKAALIPPGVWVGRLLYPLVSRYRHRLPGGTPACRIEP